MASSFDHVNQCINTIISPTSNSSADSSSSSSSSASSSSSRPSLERQQTASRVPISTIYGSKREWLEYIDKSGLENCNLILYDDYIYTAVNSITMLTVFRPLELPIDSWLIYLNRFGSVSCNLISRHAHTPVLSGVDLYRSLTRIDDKIIPEFVVTSRDGDANTARFIAIPVSLINDVYRLEHFGGSKDISFTKQIIYHLSSAGDAHDMV